MPVCCNRFRVSASASTDRSAGRTRSGSRPTAYETPPRPPTRSPPTPARSRPTRPPDGLAAPVISAGLGAAGGQRRPDRRRRPGPVDGPVVRVHPSAGAGAGNHATTPRGPHTRADGHRHRGELPLPAPVLRTPRGGRAPGVPHPSELQAGGGVVQAVAVRRGWRSVPVHAGTVEHIDRSD